MQTKYIVHTYQTQIAGGGAMERRGSECNKRTHTRTSVHSRSHQTHTHSTNTPYPTNSNTFFETIFETNSYQHVTFEVLKVVIKLCFWNVTLSSLGRYAPTFQGNVLPPTSTQQHIQQDCNFVRCEVLIVALMNLQDAWNMMSFQLLNSTL
jgi:hypothetical protein